MWHLQAVLIVDVHSEPGEEHVTALLNAVRVMYDINFLKGTN
jgi:hypothetical protein